MNKKFFCIFSVILLSVLVLAGCEQAQEGVPKDVSYVSIDKLKVEDTSSLEDTNNITEITENVISEAPESEDTDTEDVETTDAPATEDEEQTEIEEQTEDTKDFTPASEETNEKEIVIVSKETDLVRLRAVAADPDREELRYTYSSPLNTTGEWQTTYGDAGEYTITITASDGELTSSKDALLIVNRKEEAPIIEEFNPHEIAVNINENTRVDFKIKASDLNKDDISYTWKLDGEEVSTTEEFNYYADYSSAGAHTIKADVSDGKYTTSMIWSININNIDRPPVLKVISDITVKEGELIKIVPEATDPDEDKIDYSISDPIGKSGIWQTDYDSAGVYNINVAASDGELKDTQTVKVTVINVNRAPVIDNIVKVD